MKRPRHLQSGLARSLFARRLKIECLEDRRLLAMGDLLQTLPNPCTLPQADSAFGYSVATDGPYTVVGAPYTRVGSLFETGCAYVFNTSTGALIATLNNPTPASLDCFGEAVAVSGSTIVVAAGGDDTGATAYVFDAVTGNLLWTLNNPTPVARDEFGWSVAISGSTIVVGAYRDDTNATDSGSAYVFDAASGNLLWTLNNPTPAANDCFGQSVAVSGSTVVVGAYQDNTGWGGSGAAYVFDAASGNLLRTLNNPAPAYLDEFGWSVAASGSTIVVAAHMDDTGASDAGSAYVFDATSGNLLRTLSNPTPAESDAFGWSVAVSGSVVVAAAPFEDITGSEIVGTAYVFSTVSGSLLQTLNNPAPASNLWFGCSVGVSSSTIVVGASWEYRGAPTAGSAYVFDATSGNLLWTLSNPTPDQNDYFGYSVAVSGNTVVVGVLDNKGASNAGAAYVFDATSGKLRCTLNNPAPSGWDWFGTSVAISGNTVVVGAPGDNAGANATGSVYVFDAVSGNLLQTLHNPTPDASDGFGNSVAISGSTIVVGASSDDTGATDAGSAYVFDAAGGALLWTLNNPTSAVSDGFGNSVAVSGSTVVVGACLDDTGATDVGSVYIFDATDGRLLQTLSNPTPVASDNFGYSVAASDSVIVVGARNDSTGATNAGSVYVFDVASRNLLGTLNNPTPTAGDDFGYSVAVSGTKALIGACGVDGSTRDRGEAYLFDVASNQTPIAVADVCTLAEDALLQRAAPGVLANDSDPENGSLSASLVVGPAHGSLTLSSDGSFRYQPDANYCGQDSFVYRASDGLQSSTPATVTITVTPVNDPPERVAGIVAPLTVLEDSGVTSLGLAALDYGPGGGSDEISQTLSYRITAVPVATFGAVVLADGVTPVAPGDYSLDQIRGMQFVPVANANGGGSLVFQVQDDGGTANGGQDALSESLTITVTAVNDPPLLTNIEAATLGYLPKQPATPVTDTLRVTDVDGSMLVGATVQVTAGYQSNQDVLVFANTATITGSWNTATGTLTLSGSDTPANYQAALRAVMYRDTSSKPNTTTRTICFELSDGRVDSNVIARDVAFYPPVLSGIETKSATYTENKPAIVVSSKITLKDGNSPKMAGASVRISGNYQPDQDVLSLVGAKRIAATWDESTGTLMLTGADTVANYQKALRAVKYRNTSDNPITATRTVSFEVSDGLLASNTVARAIDIKAMSDAPVLSNIESSSLAYLVGSPAMQITASITVADPDSRLTSATIAISGYKKGQDLLVFADTATVKGTWDEAKGILTLTGLDTPAAYQTALRSVGFQNTAASPSLSWRAVTFSVTDGVAASKAVARSIVLVKNSASASIASEGDNPIFVTRRSGPSSIVIGPKLSPGFAQARQTLFASVQNWAVDDSH